MDYQWDPLKAEKNVRRHSVHFLDATDVFEDEFGLYREDDRAYNETRYLLLGEDAFGRILVVVYTYRGSDIRIISARKATKRERQTYEQNRFFRN